MNEREERVGGWGGLVLGGSAAQTALFQVVCLPLKGALKSVCVCEVGRM